MVLQTASLVGHIKKTNALIVYDLCFWKFFTINGVYIKAFGKLKMAYNAVLLDTG